MSTEKSTVEYNSEENFIFVKESLKATLDTLNYGVDRVVKLSTMHNCDVLLIDATELKSIPTNNELYSFAVELSQREETRKMKIHFVASKWLYAKLRFIEILAHKRGLNFKLFKNFEKAKESLVDNKL